MSFTTEPGAGVPDAESYASVAVHGPDYEGFVLSSQFSGSLSIKFRRKSPGLNDDNFRYRFRTMAIVPSKLLEIMPSRARMHVVK